MINIPELEILYRKNEKQLKNAFKNLNKKNARQTDARVHELHHEVFNRIDCLECANCCRSLGPRVTDNDIQRIAKSLRMKPSEVVNQYLRIDEDGDYVFQSMPCPFLADDNYCMIYEDRPKACREYPHTDRTNFFQIKNLTLKNCTTCPAVYEIALSLSK